ncbi:hypothetical protein [Olleya aquimaris]|jgi:hypothetical protein|uniref:Lipoprotein n=1 Tax=Olleya aquimaris TaxID=639310 RepID=A0A327RDE2_9FLAO|nr:hypothetical protein [Olleya aquimaris]RAJ11897.1 hypothetical protein LY08_02606 [Olleya aquimaris]
MKKIIFTSFIIGFFLFSCGTKQVDKFTYNFQYYDSENDQTEDKGETDLKNIISEFRSFPWKEQTSKFNNPEAKSNPTIGIKDNLNDYDFGIMSYPENNEVVYVIYHSYKVNGEWEESFREGFSKESIEKGLKLFFERKHKELPKFLEKNSKKEFGIPLN